MNIHFGKSSAQDNFLNQKGDILSQLTAKIHIIAYI